MPSRAEVLRDRLKRGEEPLGVSRRLEPLHPLCSAIIHPHRSGR